MNGALYVLTIILLIEYIILIIALIKEWENINIIEKMIAIILMIYIPIMTYIFIMGMLTGWFIK